MKKIFCLILIVTKVTAFAQAPTVFVMDANHLTDVKNKLQKKDRETLQLIKELQKKADALLAMKAVSVMGKKFTPVSGNKHDYMSQAPYFWYDSTKPNGLPYKRKDGQHNPEIKKITDRTYIGELENATQILSLAWYLTGEEKYAVKATGLIRHWFFDEATKMNPNLNYAQAIPGITNGRGIGIIESRTLMGIADAAGLLANSKSWTETDTKQLKQWYSAYLNWLLTSKNGNDEHKAKNNHGTWFYAQAIDFALFTGNTSKALQLADESKTLMNNQLTKEGQWPLELARTNALGYSSFNTSAWFTVAKLAEKTGMDLWHYKNVHGATLHAALDWLMPYALGEKKWTYQQIVKYNKNEFAPLLFVGADKFKEPKYLTRAKAINKENSNVMNELLYKN